MCVAVMPGAAAASPQLHAAIPPLAQLVATPSGARSRVRQRCPLYASARGRAQATAGGRKWQRRWAERVDGQEAGRWTANLEKERVAGAALGPARRRALICKDTHIYTHTHTRTYTHTYIQIHSCTLQTQHSRQAAHRRTGSAQTDRQADGRTDRDSETAVYLCLTTMTGMHEFRHLRHRFHAVARKYTAHCVAFVLTPYLLTTPYQICRSRPRARRHARRLPQIPMHHRSPSPARPRRSLQPRRPPRAAEAASG
jgi:hypothetical protein